MRVFLEYSANTMITPNAFTFSFEVESGAIINKVTVSWSGQTATGSSASGSKTYTPLMSLFNSSFKVSNGLSASKPGSATITATGSNGKTDTKTVFWYGNTSSSGQSVGNNTASYLTVWGEASSNGNYIRLYGYGNTQDPVKSATFTWSGQDINGNTISGGKDINNINKNNVSVCVDTTCSIKYGGSAKVTMKTSGITKTGTFTWKPMASGSISTTTSNLTFKSLIVDKANSKGLVNNNYVVGSTLRIVATVTSTNKTKTARFELSGAQTLDKTINTYGSNTITADVVATAPGTLSIKCTVTDEAGKTASRITNVSILGEVEKDLYGFYFFNSSLSDALKKNNISSIVIKLYNSFNEDNSQVDPAGLTYNLYGHTFASYNNCKSNKDMINQVTLIKTFIAPNKKKEPYIEITLTSSEIEELKKYKGIAFGLVSKDKLTIHNKQCYIDITYK